MIIKGNANLWTLLHLKFKRHLKAGHGEHGGSSRSTGADGADVYIEVPLGTVIKNTDSGQTLFEITEDKEEKIVANNLQIKWIVPLHAKAILTTLSKSKKIIIVENNYSGQFARYLRSETGIDAHGHIRKYDGEPFMPHHIVDGVKKIIAGKSTQYVPVHEITV